MRLRAAGDSHLSFSREVVYLLESSPWPGNIRELENAVARAATLCEHTVSPEDLPARIQRYSASPVNGKTPSANDTSPDNNEEWPSLAEMEGRYVARVLAHTGGNKQAATRLLRVDPKTLDRMIQRHKLVVGRTVRVLGGVKHD
jgi:DNA-binding NtrC family response regulator